MGRSRQASASQSSTCAARWGEIVAFGALLIVLGLAALCFTLPSTVATVTLNGVFFIVAGVAEIGVGAHAKSWARFFLWIIGGALYLIAGIICIINPIFASLALTLALGAGLIAAARRCAPISPFICRAAIRALMVLLAAAVTFLLGLIIVVHWPSDSRLRPGNPARRRSAVSWRRLGELRARPEARAADPPRRARKGAKSERFSRVARHQSAARIFSSD